MSSESVCQVALSWVEMGSIHKRLMVTFRIFTASVQNILDRLSYTAKTVRVVPGHDMREYGDITSITPLIPIFRPSRYFKGTNGKRGSIGLRAGLGVGRRNSGKRAQNGTRYSLLSQFCLSFPRPESL
jgi:hypothetical protein